MTALLRAPLSLKPQTDRRPNDVAAPEAEGEGSLAVSAAQSAAIGSSTAVSQAKEAAKTRQTEGILKVFEKTITYYLLHWSPSEGRRGETTRCLLPALLS